MFFIGISAHLFIYILIPALLVVWFYIKGIPGATEVKEILPATVRCETVDFQSEQSGMCAYFHATRKKQQPCELQSRGELPVFSLPTIVFIPSFYASPLITGRTLRAPPVVSCDK